MPTVVSGGLEISISGMGWLIVGVWAVAVLLLGCQSHLFRMHRELKELRKGARPSAPTPGETEDEPEV